MNFEELCVEELRFEVAERGEFQVTEPRYIFEDVPSWFVEAMKKLAPEPHWWELELPGGDGESSIMAFQDLEFWDSSWFDHVGWVDECLVAEPYGIGAEGVAAIEKFCAQTGTVYRMSGSSYHYPTATLRIEIYPKPKQE
jgi:hypothetical protein